MKSFIKQLDPALKITEFEENETQVHVYVELPKMKNRKVHSVTYRTIQDLNYGDKQTIIHLKKRIYYIGRGRKKFISDEFTFVKPAKRFTNRLIEEGIKTANSSMSYARARRQLKDRNIIISDDSLINYSKKKAVKMHYNDLLSGIPTGMTIEVCDDTDDGIAYINLQGNTSTKNIGLDDWSTKKGHSYGSILVDHVSKQLFCIIPNRDSSSVTKILKLFPIETITRDGASCFKNACSDANLDIQISDKFHIIRNFDKKVIEEIKNSVIYELKTKQIKEKSDLTENVPISDNNTVLSESAARKQVRISEVQARFKETGNIQQIAKEFKMSRVTVTKYVRGETASVPKILPSSLDQYHNQIKELCLTGLKMVQICRILQQSDSTIKYGTLRNYIAVKGLRDHRSKKISYDPISYVYRAVIKLYYFGKDAINNFSASVNEMAVKLFEENENIKTAVALGKELREVLASSDPEKLIKLIEKIEQHKNLKTIESVRYLKRDAIAIQNAGLYKFNNGRLEGSVNKVKAIKRSMYNRAGMRLLAIKTFAY